MRGEEDLKSAQWGPKRQRLRMSEDEDINFDASASRYECPGWTRGNRDRILNVKYKRYDSSDEVWWTQATVCMTAEWSTRHLRRLSCRDRKHRVGNPSTPRRFRSATASRTAQTTCSVQQSSLAYHHHHHHHHLFVHKNAVYKMTMYNWRTGHARLGKSS